MQKFQVRTEICFGEGALLALEKISGKRVFIVTDPYFMENGIADRVASLCKGAVEIFSRVVPDPPISVVAEGLARIQCFGADTLIALGGGSAIDCAKGMVALGKERPYFIAIPTTSGTGSEVTSFAILTHEGAKHPLVDPDLRPDMAILDDSFTECLPPSLIADAGMDVIAHCVEAIGGKNSTVFTNALAVSAYDSVMKLLPASFDGDKTVRGTIHYAATMAGIAFDRSGLGLCHGLSHALGGMFHIPHGKLNGILLPKVMAYNRSHAPYDLLGSNPIFDVTRLRKRLRLPQTLQDAGIKAQDILSHADTLCEAALSDPCTGTNPRPVTPDACRTILRACI